MFACRAQILKLLQNSFVLMEYWMQSFDSWRKRECCSGLLVVYLGLEVLMLLQSLVAFWRTCLIYWFLLCIDDSYFLLPYCCLNCYYNNVFHVFMLFFGRKSTIYIIEKIKFTEISILKYLWISIIIFLTLPIYFLYRSLECSFHLWFIRMLEIELSFQFLFLPFFFDVDLFVN